MIEEQQQMQVASEQRMSGGIYVGLVFILPNVGWQFPSLAALFSAGKET